jgi:(2Fe-2S) ferredoxin
MGAAVVIYPNNIWYTRVSVDDVEEIFETSVINDSVVERLVSTEETWRKLQEIRQHNL